MKPILGRPRAHRRHVPVSIHYARPGELGSSLLCTCGHAIEVEDAEVIVGHAQLDHLFKEHRKDKGCHRYG